MKKEDYKFLKKQIFLNKYFHRIFLGKKKMVMMYYKKMQGYDYDFDNPKKFTEKINSRKLDNNPLFSLCADKIKVRDYGRSNLVWIAQYNNNCTYSYHYDGWQYSDKERVSGINGNVDVSVWKS